ncbi:MAG: energy transducer TonB, partial [Verrucomicrobiota bacterium]|nr:energy transducer TonB [Verrucomicrobiota bacterium]
DQQISALSQYNMRLRATIDAAWTKPEQIAGVNLSGVVTFYVSSYGRLSNPRLTKSSGNTAFDRSIISAITLANNAGPTPTGQGYKCSLTFLINE